MEDAIKAKKVALEAELGRAQQVLGQKLREVRAVQDAIVGLRRSLAVLDELAPEVADSPPIPIQRVPGTQ